MRKINTHDFRVATRSTSRDINRRIALNLVREHQPISRAELARQMKLGRGVVSVLVNELIAGGMVYEGATGEALRGRKPTFLHVKTHDRLVVAVDVRFSRTFLMLTDFSGRQLALEMFRTIFSPRDFVRDLARRVRRLLKTHNAAANCEGMGLVVPGMVDDRTGRILNAPTLGWKGVEIRDALSRATNLLVYVENAAKACALAQMWLGHNGDGDNTHSFAYVSVSDGVGVGIVIGGELLRGHNGIAGEFGHIPLDIKGPRCVCGASGCWEAYVSNIATLSRYLGRNLFEIRSKSVRRTEEAFTIMELIARARSGDAKALNALQATARHLGSGLANVIQALNPARIYLGGEITTAWDLIEKIVRKVITERALTKDVAKTPISISSAFEYPRLRGAAALVAATTFAAPQIA